MKNRRNAIAVLVLALALSTSAYATNGIMWTGKPAPTPTPATVNSITETASADGITHTDGITHADGAESAPTRDAATQITLNLLQSVLTLF